MTDLVCKRKVTFVPVPPNRFTQKTPEGKANTINALRTRRSGKRGKGAIPKTAAMNERTKLFSEFLRNFYHGNPRRLKKLVMTAIEYAEAGHARFAELILDRLEGPVKHEVSPVTNNFNFISDSERERAKSVVDDILAMDKAIPVIPQESTCLIPATSSSSETPDSKPQTTA